jgi:transcription-repair coupling factor (superfamily II helicase)
VLRLKLYRRLADIKDEMTLASIEMEFEDRFGPLPAEVENLIFQIKVKLLASLVGLGSIGFEGSQLVLRYPALPAGVDSRDLPDLGRRVITGKNAYRLVIEATEELRWRELLIDTLMLIRSHQGNPVY